jgi:hypothetical protein
VGCNYFARHFEKKMKPLKRKIDAHKFIDEVMFDKIEDGKLFDRLAISYPKFTQWLEREYPGKKEWDQSSLGAAIEAWGIGSGKEYSERVGYPERTCQRYAVKGEDYKQFCGRLVSCPDSADQFKRELDSGERGNRPKKAVKFDSTAGDNLK